MKSIVSLVLLLFSTTLFAQQWIPLFDGTSLENWEQVGDGNVKIENGLLKTEGGMGLLWYTPRQFQDVKLRIVYKGADKNNSGVFIRIPEAPTEAWMPVNKGYEIQIDDRADEFHSTGTLYSFSKAKATPGIPGEWNEMIITLDGDRTLVHVNGVLVTDFTEGQAVPEKVETYEPDRGPRPVKGYIGIQNHGGDDVILFKEISYQPLQK